MLTPTEAPFIQEVPRRTQSTKARMDSIPMPDDVRVTCWAADWFSSVDQFRNLQDRDTSQAEFDKFKPTHRAVLAELIAQGEMIVLTASQHGLVAVAGFGLEDVTATATSLRESFRGYYGPHNSPETNRQLLGIFEAA